MKTFLAAVAFAWSMAASAQTADTMPLRDGATPLMDTITVTGTGRVTLTPDRYTFVAGVQTVAPTVEQAVSENNSRTAAVIAALQSAGAKREEIRTSVFTLQPQQRYQEGKLPEIIGYSVSNNVSVTRTNVADAGKLLQAAINAGANVSTGLQFEVSDPLRGRAEGLRGAFEDARSKAMLLAQAAGRNLGRALTINEASAAPPQPMYARMTVTAASNDVPLEAGTQERVFTVTAVFALR